MAVADLLIALETGRGLGLLTELTGCLVVAGLDEVRVFAELCRTCVGFEVFVRAAEDFCVADREPVLELADLSAVVVFCSDLEEADFFDDRDRSAKTVPLRKIIIARTVNKF